MIVEPEKMTFLTANYGLTNDQIHGFFKSYMLAEQNLSTEIEYGWEEYDYYPDDPQVAMIEVLVEGDLLSYYLIDYDDWCRNFPFKQALVHDLLEIPHTPEILQLLESNGMSSWMSR